MCFNGLELVSSNLEEASLLASANRLEVGRIRHAHRRILADSMVRL